MIEIQSVSINLTQLYDINQGGDSAGAAEGRGGPEQRGGRHQGTPHQHRQRRDLRQIGGQRPRHRAVRRREEQS